MERRDLETLKEQIKRVTVRLERLQKIHLAETGRRYRPFK